MGDRNYDAICDLIRNLEEARAYEAACEPDPNEGASPYGDDE